GVTADEGDIGRGHLGHFQDVERSTPVVLTTSQLLTTGVDAPTCKNIVLVRVVNSMTEFKQMIGRGTRVRDDYGKLYFNILDYTGTATTLFNDPEFDGEPACIVKVDIDDEGEPTNITTTEPEPRADEPPPDDQEPPPTGPVTLVDSPPTPPRKYYIDNHPVEIAGSVTYDLDDDGR